MRGIPRRVLLGLASFMVAAAVVALACISPVDDPNSTVPGRCSQDALESVQKTDILFVIDNSSSMNEEQQGIATELPLFVDELRTGAGTTHDFQIGVITTSVYLNADPALGIPYRDCASESGRLQGFPTLLPDGGTAQRCDTINFPTGPDRVLQSSDPALIDKFARLIKQGTTGSGQETPFEAVRLAVTPPLSTTPLSEGGNGGFLRDGARLLVVVVSDEDDCSETARPATVTVGNVATTDYCRDQAAKLASVDTYFGTFQGLTDSTGQPKQVAWAAIAPVARSDKRAETFIGTGANGQPELQNADCPTSHEPGFRQREMALKFDPTLANLDSICNSSYRQSLLRIAQIANVAQTVEVPNVPDPVLLKVEITRADGSTQPCTVSNGGIEYDAATEQVRFLGSCARRGDDTDVQVRLICAG